MVADARDRASLAGKVSSVVVGGPGFSVRAQGASETYYVQ